MTTPAPPDNEIVRLSMQFRSALEKRDKAAIGRLVRSYQNIYKRLEGNIDRLMLKIGADAPTTGQVVRLQRYKQLMKQIESELSDYQVYVKTELEQIGSAGVDAGMVDARKMINLYADGLGIEAGFNALPKDAIETLLGFLGEDSPLYKRLNELAPQTALQVSDAIVEGVGLGQGPRTIAREITNKLGMALTDSMRMMRTVQLWSYRESSRASYIANNHIVDGWIWHAQLDGSTCMSCVAMHGTTHSLSETLNDHHNGRCAMIPIVPGLDREFVVPETGEEWFNKQPESIQRQMMGKGKHKAWTEGAFGISDLTTTREDDVYGLMRVVKPLKDL